MKRFICAITALLVLHSAPAQKIGIGTSNPTRGAIELHGAVGATSAIFGGEGSGISLTRNWPSVGFNHYYNVSNRYMSNGYAAMQYVDPTAGYMAFDIFDQGTGNQICNSPRRLITITNNGNMWLGTNPHNSSLSVSRMYGGTSTAYFHGTTHHSSFNFGPTENTYIRGGKDGSKVFINDIPGGKIVMNGPVGINTATPAYPLEMRMDVSNGTRGLALVDVATFNYWHFLASTSGYFVLALNNVTKGHFSPNDGSYYNTSDRRVKTNIRPLSPTLEKLKKLRPVTYLMKEQHAHDPRTIGLIAQEVKSILPELVKTDAGATRGYTGITDLHTMNYTALHTLVIKAIQEQQQMIQAQEQQLIALEKEYEEVVRQLKASRLASKN